MEQNTTSWLEFRKNKLGASDAPIIMESSPFKTPYKLWREKLSLDQDEIENYAMKRGKLLEPIAREKLSHELSVELLPVVKNSNKIDYMIASMDGISADGKIACEIKCPGEKDHQIALSGRIPEKYWAQLQHQLEVCELEEMFYYSFDGENGHIVKVYRDDAFIKEMLQKEAEFWECMQSLTPPKYKELDFIERNDEAFCKAALHFQEISLKRKALEKEEKEMREYLIQLSEGHNSKAMGLTLTRVISKGRIDYEKAIQDHMQGVDLEKYRKPNVETWRIA